MPAYQTDIIRLCEKMLSVTNIVNFSEDAKKRPEKSGRRGIWHKVRLEENWTNMQR